MRMPGPRSRSAAASLVATRARTGHHRRPTRGNVGPSRIPYGASRVRCALWNAGNGKSKRGARPVVRFSPQTTTVLYDDGTADGQPDAHATALSGVEGLEELVHDVGLQADSHILHGQTHPIAVVTCSSDQELPPTIVYAGHCRSEEHTSELQSPCNLVCRLLLEKK